MQTFLKDGEQGEPTRIFIGGIDSLYRPKVYIGTWESGERAGLGVLTYVTGESIEGIFVRGHAHGVCLVRFAPQPFRTGILDSILDLYGNNKVMMKERSKKDPYCRYKQVLKSTQRPQQSSSSSDRKGGRKMIGTNKNSSKSVPTTPTPGSSLILLGEASRALNAVTVCSGVLNEKQMRSSFDAEEEKDNDGDTDGDEDDDNDDEVDNTLTNALPASHDSIDYHNSNNKQLVNHHHHLDDNIREEDSSNKSKSKRRKKSNIRVRLRKRFALYENGYRVKWLDENDDEQTKALVNWAKIKSSIHAIEVHKAMKLKYLERVQIKKLQKKQLKNLV